MEVCITWRDTSRPHVQMAHQPVKADSAPTQNYDQRQNLLTQSGAWNTERNGWHFSATLQYFNVFHARGLKAACVASIIILEMRGQASESQRGLSTKAETAGKRVRSGIWVFSLYVLWAYTCPNRSVPRRRQHKQHCSSNRGSPALQGLQCPALTLSLRVVALQHTGECRCVSRAAASIRKKVFSEKKECKLPKVKIHEGKVQKKGTWKWLGR